MVLADLGSQLTGALRKLNSATVVDDEAVDECLKEISNALMKSDVNIRYVVSMKTDIKKKLAAQEGEGINKRRNIQKLVMEALVKMVSAPQPLAKFSRGKPNVVMFVGLQGAGKTTSCTKFAHYYARKGFKTALVCADTFRAGAFDQLKQNAAKVKIPFFGSYSDTDPVRIAEEGVEKFKAEKYEMIIVDTSGRHKQEQALFEEMEQVQEAVSPHEIVFVMDSHIGQACFDQARAFHDACGSIGSVIVTKLDGHAKGGGALSAVAATGAPIRFLGTGEHFQDFQMFDASSFVSKLLGLGDLKGLVTTLQDHMPDQKEQEKMVERMSQGEFSLRDFYQQLKTMMSMGSISSLMSMIPGMGGLAEGMGAGGEEEAQKRLRRFLTMMDSMTEAELDCKPEARIEKNPTRILRIARGAGVDPRYVAEMLMEHKKFEKTIGKLGKSGIIGKDPKQMMRNPQAAMKALQGAMDPQQLKQMGGANGMMNMVKQMEGMFGKGGMGGAGGMPDMSAFSDMMQGMMGGGGKGKAGKMNALMNMMGKGGKK
ncbi:unnamed protein product [Amoebophrya sp. A25]|nr:unnamed protein product [Amoebophrya sp. A25]|eukprot:GSA25T00009875001.1